jgi:hypothetical protein
LCAAERYVWDFRDDDRRVRHRARVDARPRRAMRANARARDARDAMPPRGRRARDDATRDARDDAAMRRDA